MITSGPTAGAAVDRLAALSRQVSALVEWKIEHEARAEAKVRRHRRAVRRRRRQRVDRARALLSRLSGRW